MNKRELPSTTPLTVLGILLVVMGILAIGTPAVAGQAVVIVIGLMLSGAGLLQIVSGFRSEGWANRLPPLLLGVITLIAGMALLGNQWFGMKYIALILAISFMFEGIWKIVASFNYRPAKGWLAVLGSGLLSLLLGYLIWAQWPISGIWAVGVLVGVNLLMTGVSLLAVASTVRQLSHAVREGVDQAKAARHVESEDANGESS